MVPLPGKGAPLTMSDYPHYVLSFVPKRPCFDRVEGAQYKTLLKQAKGYRVEVVLRSKNSPKDEKPIEEKRHYLSLEDDNVLLAMEKDGSFRGVYVRVDPKSLEKEDQGYPIAMGYLDLKGECIVYASASSSNQIRESQAYLLFQGERIPGRGDKKLVIPLR